MYCLTPYESVSQPPDTKPAKVLKKRRPHSGHPNNNTITHKLPHHVNSDTNYTSESINTADPPPDFDTIEAMECLDNNGSTNQNDCNNRQNESSHSSDKMEGVNNTMCGVIIHDNKSAEDALATTRL